MNPLNQQVGGDHYKSLPIQPVEFCQKNMLHYCESAAIKYICRHRVKNGKQDIEKAIHYLQLLIQMEYKEEPKDESPMICCTCKKQIGLKEAAQCLGDSMFCIPCFRTIIQK